MRVANFQRDVRSGCRTHWSLPIDTGKETVVAVGSNIEETNNTDE